jgi:hypothetical protein
MADWKFLEYSNVTAHPLSSLSASAFGNHFSIVAILLVFYFILAASLDIVSQHLGALKWKDLPKDA